MLWYTRTDTLADGQASSADVLASVGNWSDDSGELVVSFSSSSSAGTNYTVSFNVTNPACCAGSQVATRQVSVNSNMACFQARDAHAIGNRQLLLPSVAEGRDHESRPLAIRCPSWLQASIQQVVSCAARPVP